MIALPNLTVFWSVTGERKEKYDDAINVDSFEFIHNYYYERCYGFKNISLFNNFLNNLQTW